MIKQAVHITLLFGCVVANAQNVNDLCFATKLEKEALLKNNSSHDPLLVMMAYDPMLDSIKYASLRTDLETFTSALVNSKKRFKSNHNFIRFVFRKTHAKYLRAYVKYGSFNELFYSGKYNCLTGTALYAFILNKMEFDVRIFETQYHSFLTIVEAHKAEFLIEATDPFSGLVEGAVNVQKRIDEYQKKERDLKLESNIISFPAHTIIDSIDFKELAGLHYFNLAVVYFNKAEYEKSLSHLTKAEILYPDSQRVKDFISFTTQYITNYASVHTVYTDINQTRNIQTQTRGRK